MTPKEKAQELLNKMEERAFVHDCWGSEYSVAKDCALIAVDEIMKTLNDYWNQDCKINNTKIGYYEEVKQEIEKL